MLSDLKRYFLFLRAEEIARDDEDLDRWVPVRKATIALNLNLNLTQEVIHRDLDGFARAKITLGLMETEGWDDEDLWEPVLARHGKAFSVLEDEERVRKYAITAALLKKTWTGSDGGSTLR